MMLPTLHLNQRSGLVLFTGIAWGTWRFGLYRLDMSGVRIKAVIDQLRHDPEVRFYTPRTQRIEQEAHHGRRHDRRDIN